MFERVMLIRTPDSIGFGGACCSELILTRCKNKSYSLRACLDQYSDGGRTYYDSIKGIRTPAQFLTALEKVMVSDMTIFSEYFTNYEIFEKLYEHYPASAVLAHRWDTLDRNSEELIQNFNLIAPLIEVSKVNWPATFDSGNTLAGIVHYFAFDWLSRFGALPCGVHDITGQKIVFGRYRGQTVKEARKKKAS